MFSTCFKDLGGGRGWSGKAKSILCFYGKTNDRLTAGKYKAGGPCLNKACSSAEIIIFF